MSRPINEVTVQSFYLIPRDKEKVPGFDHDLFLKVIDQTLEHVKSWYYKKSDVHFNLKILKN